MANTGYKHYTTRKEYFLDPATGLIDLTNPTGVTEANTAGTNYIPDELNYDACPLGTPIDIGDNTYNIGLDACSAGDPSTPCWHNGLGAYPTLLDTIYTDKAASVVYVGGNRFHEVGAGASMRISNLGVVTELFACP